MFPSKYTVEPDKYLILFSKINLTNSPISSGSPILPVGNFFSYSLILLTNSFTRLVLKGPGAILITVMPFFKFSNEYDLSKLLIAVLRDEDITKELPGSLIIEEEM